MRFETEQTQGRTETDDALLPDGRLASANGSLAIAEQRALDGAAALAESASSLAKETTSRRTGNRALDQCRSTRICAWKARR